MFAGRGVAYTALLTPCTVRHWRGSHLFQLEEFDAIVRATGEFERQLEAAGFLRSAAGQPSSSLLGYAKNAPAHYANRRRERILLAARRLLKESQYGSMEIPPGDGLAPCTDTCGDTVIHCPGRGRISVRAHSLLLMVAQTLEDASKDKLAPWYAPPCPSCDRFAGCCLTRTSQCGAVSCHSTRFARPLSRGCSRRTPRSYGVDATGARQRPAPAVLVAVAVAAVPSGCALTAPAPASWRCFITTIACTLRSCCRCSHNVTEPRRRCRCSAPVRCLPTSCRCSTPQPKRRSSHSWCAVLSRALYACGVCAILTVLRLLLARRTPASAARHA